MYCSLLELDCCHNLFQPNGNEADFDENATNRNTKSGNILGSVTRSLTRNHTSCKNIKHNAFSQIQYSYKFSVRRSFFKFSLVFCSAGSSSQPSAHQSGVVQKSQWWARLAKEVFLQLPQMKQNVFSVLYTTGENSFGLSCS